MSFGNDLKREFEVDIRRELSQLKSRIGRLETELEEVTRIVERLDLHLHDFKYLDFIALRDLVNQHILVRINTLESRILTLETMRF